MNDSMFMRHSVLACLLLAVVSGLLGCDKGAEVVIGGIEMIEEKNLEARQARIDLKSRPQSSRSTMENDALRFLNSKVSSGPVIKEAFCGNPPDLSQLPPLYFTFEPGVSISETASEECREEIEKKWARLESCYLVSDNGSTAYVNCYVDSSSGKFLCESSKKFAFKMLWNMSDLGEACQSS